MSIRGFLFGDPTMKMTTRHLDFLVRRSEMTAGNIANADTPGYKAKDIEFENVLEKIARGEPRMKEPILRTDSNHLPAIRPGAGQGTVVEADGANLRVDRNTVDMEDQLRRSAETALMFDLALTFIKRKGNLVASAIKDSG